MPLSLRTYLSRGCHRTVKAQQNQVRTCPLSLVRASLFYYILFKRKIALPETFYRSISLQRTELNWNKLNGLELTYAALRCIALCLLFCSRLFHFVLFLAALCVLCNSLDHSHSLSNTAYRHYTSAFSISIIYHLYFFTFHAHFLHYDMISFNFLYRLCPC